MKKHLVLLLMFLGLVGAGSALVKDDDPKAGRADCCPPCPSCGNGKVECCTEICK